MRERLNFISLLFVFFLLNGCGGGDDGELARFRTVQVLPPSLDRGTLVVDVARCTDQNGDGSACDLRECIFEDEIVSATIKALPLPNLPEGFTPSPVLIKEIEILYSPATPNSPPIPKRYDMCSKLVQRDMSESCKIRVFPAELKRYMAFNHGMVCSDRTYYYYVKLIFKLVEVTTGKEGTVEAVLTMTLRDSL